MHRQPSDHQPAETSDADQCVMQGTCSAPATALASLIWVPGVLTGSPTGAVVDSAPFAAVDTAFLLNLTLELTLPPPRS